MAKPPLMTVPEEVDGSRLKSLNPRELEQLLDMRVADYHKHLKEYQMDCSANNFTYIKPIIEVLNAIQNYSIPNRFGSILTLFMPPLYKDHRNDS